MTVCNDRSSGEVLERTTHDFQRDRSISTTIVIAMSRASETEPNDLPPLYEAVDPDALDAVFASPGKQPGRTDVTVRFPYAGHEVSVHGDGEICVYELPEAG